MPHQLTFANLSFKVFLSPFASERLLASDRGREPNHDCPVCSVAQTRVLVDMSRATLGDLVDDFLKMELGYGEEIVVNHGDNLLYDVDETENVAKKLSDLGKVRILVIKCNMTDFVSRHQGR